MNDEIHLLKLLITAGLKSDANILKNFPQLNDNEWKLLYKTAYQQKTDSLSLHGISLLDKNLQPPEKLYIQWVNRIFATWQKHREINLLIANICQKLRINGIKCLLVGGQSISRFYPDKYMRDVERVINFNVPTDKKEHAIILIKGGIEKPYSEKKICQVKNKYKIEITTSLNFENLDYFTLNKNGEFSDKGIKINCLTLEENLKSLILAPQKATDNTLQHYADIIAIKLLLTQNNPI